MQVQQRKYCMLCFEIRATEQACLRPTPGRLNYVEIAYQKAGYCAKADTFFE